MFVRCVLTEYDNLIEEISYEFIETQCNIGMKTNKYWLKIAIVCSVSRTADTMVAETVNPGTKYFISELEQPSSGS